jgi:hypothetical protein
MKMLLSASDEGRISEARKQLFQAGIPCEIRQKAGAQWPLEAPSNPELWVSHDGDVLKAMKLLGSGRTSQLVLVFSAS